MTGQKTATSFDISAADPEANRDAQPSTAVAEDPPPCRQECQQEEQGVDELGPTADIADRLGLHGMQAEERGGHESRDRRRDLARRTRRSVGPAIQRRDPGKAEQQQHVDHVQEHAGGVVAEGLRRPDRAIQRVGEIDDRPRHLAEDDVPDVGDVFDRRVVQDRAVVVVDVRIVQRIEIDQTRIDCRDAGEPPVSATAGRA